MRIIITKMGDITNVKCISRTGGDSSIFEFHTIGDVTVDDQRERVTARREEWERCTSDATMGCTRHEVHRHGAYVGIWEGKRSDS